MVKVYRDKCSHHPGTWESPNCTDCQLTPSLEMRVACLIINLWDLPSKELMLAIGLNGCKKGLGKEAEDRCTDAD